MDPERIEKAQEALNKIRTQNLLRQIKLHRYTADMERAARWCLPFRMVHDRQFPESEEQPADYFDRPLPYVFDGYRIVKNPAAVPPITAEEAVYYFTRFLVGIDFSLYGNADWTGKAITQAEADRLRQRYEDRQRDYRQHPERYDTQARPRRRSLFDEVMEGKQ